MTKFLKVTALAVAAVVLLGIAGPPLVALLISAAIVAGGLHYFTKSTSLPGQIIWGSLIAVGVLSALSNVPGLVVLAIAGVVYYFYKNGDMPTFKKTTSTDDPFDHFEREWAKMNR